MKNRQAFTLIEMIVVVTILSILSLIGFVSFSENIITARDSQRMNDIDSLQINLKSHKQKEGSYPLPISPVSITNSIAVISQGVLTDSIVSNVITSVPKDPRTSNWYWYSTTTNRQQFQIALTLENTDTPKAVVEGDYRSVTKDLFPTLLLAVTGATTFDASANTSKFIVNGGTYNLPYDMSGTSPVGSGASLSAIRSEPGVLLQTGGSYLSCVEIYEAGRSMGSGAYQILNNSGTLSDTGCLMNY